MDHNDLIIGAIFGLFLCIMATDLAVAYTGENNVRIVFTNTKRAREVYQGLLASGHSAKLDDTTIEVCALRRWGCRPNQAAWMLWQEVNHLSVINDTEGFMSYEDRWIGDVFQFGDRWYDANPFAEPKRLDWATPPQLTTKKWWGVIAKQILGIS
jgi:hypothetical protein